jgi:MFS family permease
MPMTFSLLAIATLLGGLLIGLVPALVDGVQTSLKARLNLPEGRGEWFVRLFYLAWLPGMPLAGWMLDTWHNKEILFFGLFALILGIMWLALLRTSVSLMVNAILLGLGYSCVTTAAVRLMTEVFFPNYVHDFKLNIASLNLGFVMVGLGAILGPWIVRAVERWWGFRQGLLYLSVVLIAPAALAALCERDLFPNPPTVTASWDEVLNHGQMALMGGAILLYFALENCLEFWPESYLKELGYQERGLQISLLIFWLAFIAMRGVAAWWFYYYPSHSFPVTLILVLVSAFILGNLAGGYEVGSSSLWFWLLGACYGPLLPGLLGMAMELYHPKSLPVSVLGALLALSGFDTLAVRPLMTGFGKDRAPRSVMRVPTLIALILAAPLLLLAFIRY